MSVETTDWTNKVPPPPPSTRSGNLMARGEMESLRKMADEILILRGELAELRQQVKTLGDKLAERVTKAK